MKQKRSLNKFILMITTITLAIVAVFLFVTRPTKIDRLGQAYIDTIEDKKVVKDAVQSSYKETYGITDYTFYGEALKFYQKEYSDKSDDLQGKNVILHNIETGKEFSYTFSSGGEDGIHTGLLEPGLYEVYIYDHFIKKRLFFKDEVHVSNFTTMRRDKNVLTIHVDASKDFLERFDVNMDKNYVFISVTENIPMVKNIDVMIDPCGDIYNSATNTIMPGSSNDKISEQEASYELACLLKEELESKGLRVGLTRDKDGSPSYYGNSGRVAKGYDKKAKVFISLAIAEDGSIEKPLLMVSPYASGILANNIVSLCQQNGVKMADNYASEGLLQSGVIYDSFIENEDEDTMKFEQYPQLRECGGKITLAGTEENSKDNARYAQSDGMYGLLFFFCNLKSEESIDYYKKNQENIVKGMAEGIYQYFSI